MGLIVLLLCSCNFLHAQNHGMIVERTGPLDSSFIKLKVELRRPSCKNAVINIAVLDSLLKTVANQRYFLPPSGMLNISVPIQDPNKLFGAVIYSTCDEVVSDDAFIYSPGMDTSIFPLKNRSMREVPFYFEGGKALKNYYTRVLLDLNGRKIAPAAPVVVRNQHRQVVAKGVPDANQILAIDLPLFEHDQYRIETFDGNLIKEVSAADTTVVAKTGISLRTLLNDNVLHVDIRKGIAEGTQQAKLTVHLKETVLYESLAIFREDTSVVETTVPLQGLENALLELRLTDEAGKVLASRMVTANGSKALSSTDDLFFPFPIADTNRINDYLIAASKSDRRLKEQPEFTARFLAPGLKGKTINYQIQLQDGAIEEIGNVVVDTAGIISISGLRFKGKASILFYGNDIASLASIAQINDTLPSSILAQIKSKMQEDKAAGKMPVSMQRTDGIMTGEGAAEVVGKTKSRSELLEEKYISSNMFKEQFSISLDLENDPYTANYDVYDYLLRKVPGLSVKSDPRNPSVRNFLYRQGVIEVYLDETYIGQVSDLPFKNLQDIGYIRFLKKPVSSSRNAAGGAMLRGSSAIAGVTGTLLIYTKKQAGDMSPKKAQTNRLEIMGFANE